MQNRSCSSLFLAAILTTLLTLTGCASGGMQPQQIFRDVSKAVSSWGASFMKGATPSEEVRVNAEYQKAFDTTGDSRSGIRYLIDTKSSDGPVRITLTIMPFEIIPPATQCRNFIEAATVGGKAYPPEARRACKYNGKEWVFTSR